MQYGVVRWIVAFIPAYIVGKIVDSTIQSKPVWVSGAGSAMVVSAPMPVVVVAAICGFITAFWPTISGWFAPESGVPPKWWRMLHRPKTLQAEMMMLSVEIRRLAKRSRRDPKTQFKWSSERFNEHYYKWYALIKAKLGLLLPHMRDQPAFQKLSWDLTFVTPAGPDNIEKIAELLQQQALLINAAIPPTDLWL